MKRITDVFKEINKEFGFWDKDNIIDKMEEEYRKYKDGTHGH